MFSKPQIKLAGWLLLALAAVLLSWALATAYVIPSDSMERSLLVGDYVSINKLTTDDPDPQRNDVVVFYAPYEPQRGAKQRTLLIKRCVAGAGDTLAIRRGQVLLNGRPAPGTGQLQLTYFLEVAAPGDEVQAALRALGIVDNLEPSGLPAVTTNLETGRLGYLISCPAATAAYLRRQPYVRALAEAGGHVPAGTLFPDQVDFRVSQARSAVPRNWQLDDYGPLAVPKKGQTIALTPANAATYYKIVAQYEPNPGISWQQGRIYQHGRPLTQYTIKQNYYFVLGDNRHNSEDSRFWGFVPENYLVGRAARVWFSLDPYADALHKIRWHRIGRPIR
ncbi:signal peptidase I [Hymenobacter bucti]|uniref:Signal peptidase I n=1 Tax=Hymenobacter bucti TaxID=1844114 RepID=A0ABW4QRZ2_9BACT